MKWKAHFALFSVALIYGANYTIAKNVLDQDYLQPNGFILLRVIAGVVLFSLFHLLWIREKVSKSDFIKLFFCGLFGVAINQLFFFKGLAATSPIHASLIMLVTPIAVMLISSIYFRERLRNYGIAGIILGTIGAVLLINTASGSSAKMASVEGDIYILINALSYGCYLVLVRGLMKKYHPFTVMKWAFSFGLLIVFPVSISDLQGVEWSSFSSNIWWAIAYVLFMTTFLAYGLNAYALSKVTATTASTYIYLQPFIASVIAIMFYNDRFSMLNVLCAVLIFSGVYLVSMPSKSLSN